MASRSRVAVLIAANALLSSALLAQTDGKILGRVVDREGNPVVGADVVLHSQDVIYRSDLGPGVTHRVKSGARGRFSFRIDASRTWSAWATWTDASGRPHASTIRERLGDGAVTTLPEDDIEHAKRTLVIRNADAWRQRGPLRYRVVAPTLFRYWVDLEVPNKDAESAQSEIRVALPPMPGLEPWLEIFDREGYPLHNWPLTNDGKATVTVTIPTPRRIAVRVVDETTKQPVSDASVLWAAFAWPHYAPHEDALRSLSVRDFGMAKPRPVGADGIARLYVCWPDAVRHYRDLVAFAPDHERRFHRFHGNAFEETITLEVGPSRTVGCAVRDRDGNAIPEVPCYVSANAAMSKTGYMNYAWRRLDTTPDGTLSWTAALPRNPTFVCLAPTRDQLARLLPTDAGPLLTLPTSRQLFWAASTAHTNDNDEDLENIGFGSWASHEVIAKRSDGAPAARALLLCQRRDSTHPGDSQDIVLSRDGRALLVLSEGMHDVAIIDLETGDFATQSLSVSKDRAATVQRLQIALAAPFAVDVEARDASEKPLANAKIHYELLKGGGPWEVIRRALEHIARHQPPTDANGRARVIVPTRDPTLPVAAQTSRMLWHDRDGKVLRSDSQLLDESHRGTVTFHFLFSQK
ncbi:MAG: carboxypeptidase regulatory-like domain-containing protein [Planctomycetes bacterium]|nr:carboxypeptidase regulatory-like domain-containing protein [Planctomycetota bacterium]MCB9918777.1 carboxypeptidase regulatory-like domain-containing protein [Planctomycetota bacterium]